MIKPVETVDVTVNCALCGGINVLTLEVEAWEAYKRGESHVQALFPDLSVEDRELLCTRTCAECWKKTFPESDQNENE